MFPARKLFPIIPVERVSYITKIVISWAIIAARSVLNVDGKEVEVIVR